MAYYIHYKVKKRNWGQHTLGDYIPGIDEQNMRILDAFEEGRWQLKREKDNQKKKKGSKNNQKLRRGRKRKRYPTKNHYFINNPRDVGELKRFSWYSPIWRKTKNHNISQIPKGQTTLDESMYPNLINNVRKRIERVYIPHFRMPSYVQKHEFCESMSEWAWAACHMPTKKVGLCSHVFYLNSFDIFDDPEFMDEINWIGKALPSDLIKLEVHRLLQGFESINDYFRMHELSPIVMDPQSINMTHSAPSSHHYSEYLKKIGYQKVNAFFKQLVNEARHYGLIRDVVHMWDGQFHETWLKRKSHRKNSLEQFFGGTYNHGGKKVGIGVYQSTIMDWNGYCAIPIHTEVVPANRNENPVVRETVKKCYGSYDPQPAPYFFLADRGPSGYETQKQIWDFGSYPIIPLKKNVKNDVIITEQKKHRFYKEFVGKSSGNALDGVFAIRTRIEEHYNLNDTVYRTAHLHCMGEVLTKMEILLLNCLGVLIPLTAYKIGRPDLMWSPTMFRSHQIHPERVFPDHFRELDKMRWDNTIVKSPYRYRYESSKK